MKKDEIIYLKHILDAVSRIEEYTQGVGYEDFMENHLIQDGVIRQVEIIGESARRLYEEIGEKYLYILWKDIAKMKDKLIHSYFGVDLGAVSGYRRRWHSSIEE